jgi:hypothetical protein
MSAALQLPSLWGQATERVMVPGVGQTKKPPKSECVRGAGGAVAEAAEPVVTLAFYRKHTESILRRYLYASMQVGRTPSLLVDSVGRGWASSRTVRTFEDAVIFVLDVERCLNRLGALDRQMLSRVVLQEYTQAEAAVLLGMGVRTISYKFPLALDHLTELLLESGLLVLPH